MEKKALIAMSGGVDSSVAAFLMQQRGWKCAGVTMVLYRNEDIGIPPGRTCCSQEDVEDARSVARRLKMPFYPFNFQEDFRRQVMDRFAESYRRGRTPNPCIDCNRYLKFSRLYERASLLECSTLVTGHYARIEREGGRYLLKKAADAGKDQSYVLYMLTQSQLGRTAFPLGNLTKDKVREIAAAQGFYNAQKPDSQDICFVPDGDYAAFIRRYTKQADVPGDFVDQTGRVLGRHRGISHYTVGQRRGLGIAADKPLYVTAIDPDRNQVVLGDGEAVFSQEVTASGMNWIAWDTPPREPFRANIKVRYRQKEQPAWVAVGKDGAVHAIFDDPQRAITPGQALVLYKGDIVLGGGTIL